MNSLTAEANKDIENNISKEKLLNNEEQKEDDNSVTFNFYTIAKLVIFFMGVTVVILNSYTGFALPNSNVDCFLDKSFEITASINQYLHDNLQARHFLIAFSSFCVDFLLMYMGIHWCLYGKSWRLLTAIFFFYGIRGVVQNIFQMKYPEGYLWEYPGFPSIFVSYLKTNDFFFSGHVGLPILVGLECRKLNKTYFMIFSFFTCIVEGITMVLTRGHYIIDIITGMAIAHYFFIVVDNYLNFMDNYFPIDKSNIKEDEFKPALIKQ